MGKHFCGKTYALTQAAMNGLIKELEETQVENRIMREALERIERGTHEEHPTCMGTVGGEFGPPRTGGWEGWAREIRAWNIAIAKEALSALEDAK